ncbi:response regulator transcription factor [Virgibacillus chiguensis]|uniref:DNA-binding response regulator, OmpR family, contains REC and winged-helix (WHTH) domain n=1 Tax=Virgibacillus chiguensis TaxID=411959 RepID=A0A1M5S1A0_9BACI|nr:response regulator transcription factor [Virgibacillus chiguensis]SHH32422.1 DNA-binding response regulator, OmpR family, contains REC and winged-helix (wHTH) domain [Virgibacillus chiguensis]
MEENILLVEDDMEIARIIRDMLMRNHYQVAWATTGLEGWEDFEISNYDLVIVDVMLPEMDGFSLCKNIRLKSDVPMIIISARKADGDKVKGLGLGADDYIAKPFSMLELKARVESHLRRWRRFQGVPKQTKHTSYVHGLMVDWKERHVSLQGKRITLTDKEWELLTVLAKHPEQTFSKKELYQHIWQQVELDGIHTVTVHIKSLREKLQDSVKTPRYIQTVWGKGYRFIGDMQ